MRIKYVKYLGLLGALFTGGSLILAGSLSEGVGIIAAALSSASLFKATA